jgi:hypothetical protein
MKSTLIIIEILAAVTGLILVLYDVFLHRRLKRKDALIHKEDENRVFMGFLLKNTGLPLFVFAACFLCRTLFDVSPLVFIFSGILAGFISAFWNVVFWALSEDKYKTKPSLGEPVGAVFLGCAGFVIALVLGAGLGFAFYFITK